MVHISALCLSSASSAIWEKNKIGRWTVKQETESLWWKGETSTCHWFCKKAFFNQEKCFLAHCWVKLLKKNQLFRINGQKRVESLPISLLPTATNCHQLHNIYAFSTWYVQPECESGNTWCVPVHFFFFFAINLVHYVSTIRLKNNSVNKLLLWTGRE